MATKGTAWVARRSTDLVPSLLAMAFAEWRSGQQNAGQQSAGRCGDAGTATEPTEALDLPV